MIQLPPISLESFFATFNIRDFAVSPDESQIVYSTNLQGQYDLWALDRGQGYPYPLTRNGQMSHFIKHLPDGKSILTSFDQDGDENWQIYALSSQGGELAPLLINAEEKFYFGDLSLDGQRLYFYTSENNQRYHNIVSLNLQSGEQKMLLEGEQGPVYLSSVSPNQKSIAYLQSLGNTRVLGYLRIDDEDICVTPESDSRQRVHLIKYWDNDTAYLLTNYGEEFAYLARYHIPSRIFEKVCAVEGHELSDFRLDQRHGRIYLVGGRGVQDRLFALELDLGEVKELPAPVSVIAKLEVGASGKLYLLGRSATSPANLYTSGDGIAWHALTAHRILGVTEKQLTEPEVLTYPSYDGLEIEALYYAPAAAVDNGHTVLWPHGGPQAAERKWFRPLLQYLCLQGYRVFAPNYRGSSGYGETFMNLVNKDWGGGPRLDIVAGMEWLDSVGKSESGKWFCVGGSYGGYMTLLLHGRHPELFKAFVDEFGPSNLFTTIETAPEHWKAADAELIGDPVADREKLIEDSPMTYLDAMTKPMLVVQGANDPRVVQAESDAIVEALRARGQFVEYILLPDEGHGYSKTENAIKVYQAIAAFLDKIR